MNSFSLLKIYYICYNYLKGDLMGEIIDIKEYKKDNNLCTKIIEKFEKIEDDISKFAEDNKEALDDKFYSLYERFKKTKSLLNNKKWISENKMNKFLLNFDDVTNDENLINSIYLKLEYIEAINSSRGEILNFDDEYIKLIINALCTLDDLPISNYNHILEILFNDEIINIINSHKNNQLHTLIYIIDCIMNGDNILEIKQNFSKKEIFSTKLNTIENIYSYYNNSAYLLFESALSDKIFNNIDSILFISKYNNITKSKFINLVNKFKDKELGVLSEIKYVSQKFFYI